MENKGKIVCGMTHVDLGWKKTRREMEEVFENYIIKLLDLCEQYPDFTYMLEQAYHYRGLKKRRPDLFARLIPFVESGRLQFVTGLASTIENNTTCGESFVRNMQIGNRFIEREFGVKVHDCAMIDTFGFPPQMPQMLSQMGFKRLLANRLGCCRSNDVMYAVGLDGSRILLAGSDILAYRVNPGHVNFRYFLNYTDQRKLFSEADKNDVPIQIIIPYSENEVIPCRLIPEIVHESQGKYRFGHLKEFFDALEDAQEAYPEVPADMNPEFSGTFSLRQRLRLANRQAETLLLEAEKVSALYGIDAGEEIEECWWTLSYVQFHDVLTGSHPTEVYLDALDQFEEVCSKAKSIISRCITEESNMSQQGIWSIWNGLPYARREKVDLKLPDNWRGVSSAEIDGQAVEFMCTGDSCVSLNLPLNSMKAHRLYLEEGEWQDETESIIDNVIENKWIRLEFDESSMIGRMIYKPTDTVIMKDVNDLLVFQKDMGNFQIEHPVHSEITTAVGRYKRRLYRRNGVGYARFEGAIDDVGKMVPYRIILALEDDEPALKLTVHVDWNSEAARLRLKLNACMSASENIYEVPFGAVARKPYTDRYNSRGEWPTYRFVCMEAPWENKGIALINRGVVGVETADGVLYSTLLRAPATEYAGMVPDDTSSDHGEHDFEFLIVPYAGCWQDAGVVRLAERFNNPPVVCDGKAKEAACGIRVEGDAVLSAILASENGDIVIRLYESHGRESDVLVTLPHGCRTWLSGLNQERESELELEGDHIKLHLKPFEIKTLVYNSELSL